MYNYILVMGRYSIDDAGREYRPTLIGIVDPSNPRNTVSIRDILLSRRVSEVLYNMGIAFRVEPARVVVDGITSVSYGVLPEIREHINSSVYYSVEIARDIWSLDYKSDDDTVAKAQIFSEFKGVLGDICESFSEADYEYVIEKLALDSNLFIYCQTHEEYAIEADCCIDYILYGGKITGERVKNLTTITPKGYNRTAPETMLYPTDNIPFTVPSFYDLICYDKYKDKLAKDALMIDEDAIDYSIEDIQSIEATSSKDDNGSETNLFGDADDKSTPSTSEKDNSTFSYRDIYEPFDSDVAKIMNYVKGVNIPKISDTSIRVTSITEFWRVHPAQNIPAEAFGVSPQGKKYELEDLTGHSNLNSLSLQANEKDYYYALENLLKIAVSIENNAISEEVYETVKSNISPVVENYCKTLAEQAFNLMWCHTGTTQPVSEKEYDTDKSEDAFEGDTVVIFNLHCWHGDVRSRIINDNRVVYEYVPFYSNDTSIITDPGGTVLQARLASELPRLYMGFDGSVESGFVHHDGALVGYVNERADNHRWIDALIRLLRWGERKPSMLTNEPLVAVTKKDNTEQSSKENTEKVAKKYWNLNTASISSHDGNISDKEPEIDAVTKNSYKITAIISCDIKVPIGTYASNYPKSKLSQDPGGVVEMHIPVGVVLEQKMRGCDCYHLIFEDIFTYYDKLIKGENRGQIKLVDGKFVSAFGEDDFVEVEEIELSQAVESLKEVERHIPNENTKEDTLYKFSASLNADIASSRSKICGKILDSDLKRTYISECNTSNIFNSIATFAPLAIKESFLRLGSKFESTQRYPSNNIGIQPEKARIVYNYLDRLGNLRYTSMNNRHSVIAILTQLHEINNSVVDKAETVEGAKPNGDPCFEDFCKIMSVNPEGYVFIQLTAGSKNLPLVIGIGRDKAKSSFAIMTSDDYTNMLNKLGIELEITSETLSKKYLMILKTGVICWNKNNKELRKASCNVNQTDGSKYTIIMASNKAMQLSDNLMKQLSKK